MSYFSALNRNIANVNTYYESYAIYYIRYIHTNWLYCYKLISLICCNNIDKT